MSRAPDKQTTWVRIISLLKAMVQVVNTLFLLSKADRLILQHSSWKDHLAEVEIISQQLVIIDASRFPRKWTHYLTSHNLQGWKASTRWASRIFNPSSSNSLVATAVLGIRSRQRNTKNWSTYSPLLSSRSAESTKNGHRKAKINTL